MTENENNLKQANVSDYQPKTTHTHSHIHFNAGISKPRKENSDEKKIIWSKSIDNSSTLRSHTFAHYFQCLCVSVCALCDQEVLSEFC